MIPKVGRENTFRVRRYFRLFPLVFFLTGVLALLLSGRRKSLTHPSQPILLEEVPAGRTPSAADDLTLIEGIGPKVAAVLHAAGITRFEQLAALPPAELKRLLIAAGNRLSDPATWPEQAALAASGDWEGLKALQSSLNRGRRTG
ncbi:protein containing helix-hairpin-helix domain [Bellilinea caldifistulae]|uniref:helix-hairpin-helix domain-containing protein n=1 Tax=Bellilinea caldifistulae TaxID=360411 RepID=UPI00078304FA|nr:helix-hairpin-helix domain-containing protein [Bellilinea caldifistulae]GAP09414.1 protein containing helix-hairpin-helix domain [Bellilinea caldifistulae]